MSDKRPWLDSDRPMGKADRERCRSKIPADQIGPVSSEVLCMFEHTIQLLEQEVKGLERFRDLRTRHNDEMGRKQSTITRAIAELQRGAPVTAKLILEKGANPHGE